MAEQDPVKVKVVGSSPTPGAKEYDANFRLFLKIGSSHRILWLPIENSNKLLKLFYRI